LLLMPGKILARRLPSVSKIKHRNTPFFIFYQSALRLGRVS
jgi:hypothetical protein